MTPFLRLSKEDGPVLGDLDQLEGISMSDVQEVLQLVDERLLPLMTLRRPVLVLLQHLPLLKQLLNGEL